MADEPRRSVRATKGQHTKSLDLLDAQPEPPKKKSTKKAKKAAEEPAAEIIRCVCGATETGENDTEPWIACDKCEVWQHNVCVGVSTFDEDIPGNYLCEECGPSFHGELLNGTKAGLRVWEDRRRAYEAEQEEAEREGPKKRNRKKGKRTSTPVPKVDLGHATNGKAAKASPAPPPPQPAPAPARVPTPARASVEAPAKKEKKEPVARAGSTKRKARDDSHEKEAPKEQPQAKVRKVSAAHISPRQDSPPSTSSVKIIDLESSRAGGAKLILKGVRPAIEIAVKNGVYTLSKDDTLDTKSEKLACQIEDAVYSTHPDKTAYKNQARALGFNLKHNQELCNGLLARTLKPSALAVMSSDDMASKELKRETAEMKARADKQSIMISDEGPRIRRTHKGEELVEGDSFALPSDNTMSTSRRRSMMDPNGEMAARSRENSFQDEVELPEDIDTSSRPHTHPKKPLNIETKPQPGGPMRKASVSDNFDIHKVFSSVSAPTSAQSPTSATHNRRMSAFSPTGPPADGPGVDPEIDKMLQDDATDSPPYSPAEFSDDPDVKWRGAITMDSIARFPGIAKHVGGADVSRNYPWTDILQKDLRIAGRIDAEKANEYLCSLRYSPPTDVVVVNVTPTGEVASQGFQTLYDYFLTRNKYGVLANKGVGNIRDTYLVPVPPNPGNLPDFIINLEGHKVPEVRPDPMILIALVIRNEIPSLGPDHRVGGFDGQQSPSVLGHPQRQMSISGAVGGPQMSPIAPPQGLNPFSTPPIPHSQLLPDHNDAQKRQQEEQRLKDQKQREGEVVANRILGDFARAPTVAFLMPQAFQMRMVEWEIIRGILEEDEKARTDLQHLGHVLELRMAAQG